MIALQNSLSLESNRKDIGKEFEVLVEGTSKRNADELFGRTSQNKVAVFPASGVHPGDFVRVLFAVHRLQYGIASALHWEVDMACDVGVFRHHFKRAVAHVLGV